jgi:hypothetical protein
VDLVSVDAQTQALISAAAQLRGQIVVKEVQLQALRQSAGPENPEMLRVMAELQSLRNQLSKLEGGTEARPGSAKDAAEGLQNVRLFRELKYQEAVYTAMLQQFQLAKVDEAKDAPLIQQDRRGQTATAQKQAVTRFDRDRFCDGRTLFGPACGFWSSVHPQREGGFCLGCAIQPVKAGLGYARWVD